ncbi:hypothetical protein [Sulfurimonas sp.]
MNNDYIDLIEPTPKLHSKKCRFTAFGIKLLLQFTSPALALIIWYVYDYFIAGATLLISFIVVGIIRAKMRNSVIPIHQREFQYNDEGIAAWFTAKELCIEESITSNESLSHNEVQIDSKRISQEKNHEI